MSQIGFLVVGYSVIWVALGTYFVAIGRRQRTLRREIEQLEQEMRSQG
ncbi:MAG: CcmD family protein [Thermoleophilia bacterium]